MSLQPDFSNLQPSRAIGEGAGGIVHMYHWGSQDVAVKKLSDLDQDLVPEEVMFMRDLRHQNIVL